MRSYCVKQKKETECVPGSERIIGARNGRQMSTCVCTECGITKTKFVKGKQTGGANTGDFSCGYDLKGRRPGTVEECFKKGQIRRYGIKALADGYIDVLLADRRYDRNEKARARRVSKKPLKLPKLEDIDNSMIDAIYEKLMKEDIRTTKSAPRKTFMKVDYEKLKKVDRPAQLMIEPPPRQMSEEEKKKINKYKTKLMKEVFKEAGKKALEKIVKNLKRKETVEVENYDVTKLGKNKFEIEDDDEISKFTKEEDVVEFLFEKVNRNYKAALAKDFTENHKEEIGRMIVEKIKRGRVVEEPKVSRKSPPVKKKPAADDMTFTRNNPFFRTRKVSI